MQTIRPEFLIAKLDIADDIKRIAEAVPERQEALRVAQLLELGVNGKPELSLNNTHELTS